MVWRWMWTVALNDPWSVVAISAIIVVALQQYTIAITADVVVVVFDVVVVVVV
jgi:hypothetical protein